MTIATLATRQEKGNVKFREIPSRHESVYKLTQSVPSQSKMMFTAEFSQSGWRIK
jgi:hypothetical protein